MASIKEWAEDNPAAAAGAGAGALVLIVMLIVPSLRRFLLKVLCTVYLQTAFWLSHILCLVCQIFFVITCKWWMPERYLTEILAFCQQITALFVMVLNPFWRMHCVRRHPDGIPKSAIVVSNHLSFVDSWVVCYATFPIGPKFIAMSTLFSVPILGQVMYFGGHIPVKFFRKEGGRWGVKNSAQIMDRAKQYLSWGLRVAVFPEGARSKTGEFGDFKIGFFKLAHEQNRPIVPIPAWGNQYMFPIDGYGSCNPTRVCYEVGAVINPSDFETPELLRDHVLERMREMRDALPNFSYDQIEKAKAREEARRAKRAAAREAKKAKKANVAPQEDAVGAPATGLPEL